MIRNIFKISLCLLGFCTSVSYGQGCSDAGFCTINSFKPQSTDSAEANVEFNNQVKIGFSFGNADRDIAVLGTALEYNRILSDKFALDVKLTALLQTGNGISVFGLSDLYLNTNYNINKNAKFTIGLKIPLTNGNRKIDGIALPMDYQASLGTLDFIVGFGYQIKKLQLVAAFQQPLTQNQNAFLAGDYPITSELSAFQSTNKFKRSGDVLLRVSYPINLGKKFKITPSILPIYHLTKDRYFDRFANEIIIPNSEGLTLNGNVYFDLTLNEKNALQLNAGMPFVVRASRPDGLTRSFIINLEYRAKF